ncbi:TetR/AcrR family transcriptional regulator [Brachybacterium subflavum]|uniref:TetR/AcrR family transcriptional regulator n=1 Tax=Brachybacterium subflavum TaxID=2585206 RepID=UPI00126607E1|nr:TetR family transcriptional regulator [Brachybacterium subflavum]
MTTDSGRARPTGRPGRRPGPSSTREQVLEAARARFAADGFASTTIRRIAADAGVDPSQVMQFFGTKERLYAAVLEIPDAALEQFATAFDGPEAGLGERVVRSFLAAWEGSPQISEPLMAMLRGAIVHDVARDQLREFIQARLLEGVRGRATGDESELAMRAGLVSAMLVGVVMGRRVIGVPTLAEADPERIVDVLAPAVQRILAGE